MASPSWLRWRFQSWQKKYKQSWQPRRFIPCLVIGSTILVMSATAGTCYYMVRGLIIENWKASALAQTQKASDEIDEWLATLVAHTESIANTPAVRSLNWSVAEPYLQLELDRLPDFHMFVLAKSDGSYYTTKLGLAKANIRDRTHFQRAIAGKTIVADPVLSRATKVPQVNISVPIWSVPPFKSNQLNSDRASIRGNSLIAMNLPSDPYQPARPIGVFSAPITIKCIGDVMAQMRFGKGSYAFILDSQGKPIAYSDQSLIEDRKSFLDNTDPGLLEISQAMVKHQTGIQKTKSGGSSVYVAYLPLHQADWSLALVIPQENLQQQLNALNLLASVLGMLLLGGAIIALRQVQSSEETRALAEREALLNRITARIRESLDLKTILQTTVDEVASLLNLDRVNFSWYRLDHQMLEVVCEYRQEDLSECLGIFDIQAFDNLGDRFLKGETICFEAITKDPNLTKIAKEAYLQLGAGSYLAMPVFVANSNPAYLICIRTTPKPWSNSELELLEAVANQLAIAINQARLYIQTKEQVKIVSEQAKRLSRTPELIQSEKMYSLGQLIAGVAHEINNPVSFIYGNLIHATQYTEDILNLLYLYQQHYPQPAPEIQAKAKAIEIDFLAEDFPKLLSSMEIAAERIRQLVLSLRSFSRLDETQMRAVDIHEGIDSTLLILQHRLKARDKRPTIKVIKEYGNLPEVECYAGQLNQVFMNIFSNAIDALEESLVISHQSLANDYPQIRIRTQVIGNEAINISITDNGPGMSEAVISRLFDPFFTTKPADKGTGLGLAISYQIVVEKHGGQLRCISAPGEGTEFMISLPIHAKKLETSVQIA